MKKSIWLVLMLASAVLVFAEGKPQTNCPVMGGVVSSNYVDVEGYRIYVCCKGCIGAIKANPAKFIEKMKAEGVEIAKTPVKTSEK